MSSPPSLPSQDDFLVSISLPDESLKPVDEALQTKFDRWTKLQASGITFIDQLESNSLFRNPSITRYFMVDILLLIKHSKMVDFLELDQHGTYLKPTVYDRSKLPLEGYFDYNKGD